MKNKYFRVALLTVLVISLLLTAFVFAGCKKPQQPSTPEKPIDPGPEIPVDPVLPSQITMEVADEFFFYYDGNAHSINYTVSPSDATVTFTVNGKEAENSFTELGEYNVTIKASKQDYLDFTKQVKVKITKKTSQVEANETQLYYYDGKPHYAIFSVIPSDSEYTVTMNGEPAPQSFTQPGKYNLQVHVEGNEFYEPTVKNISVVIAESRDNGIYADSEQIFYYEESKTHSVDFYTLPIGQQVTITKDGQPFDNVFSEIGEYNLVLSCEYEGQTYTKEVKAVVKEKETITITAEQNQKFYFDGKPHYPEYTLSDENAKVRFEIMNGDNTDVGTCFIKIIVDETYWNKYAEKTVTLKIEYKNTINAYFDAQGGTVSGDNPLEIEYGKPYSLPIPEREGFEFVNWFNTDTQQIVEEEGSFWEIRQDCHFVAIWSSTRPYTDKMEINASADSVTVEINNVGSTGIANVVALPAYAYLPGENYQGLSDTVIDINSAVADYNVGFYYCGINSDVRLPRFENGDMSRDMLYRKYYVIQDSQILAGPFYVTDVEAQNSVSAVETDSIKGLFSGAANDYEVDKLLIEDLGLKHAKVNLPLMEFIMPREDVGYDGKVYEDYFINRYTEDNSYKHTVNGTDYYFWKSTVDELDKTVKNFTDNGVKVTLVVYSINLGMDDQWRSPFFLHYPQVRLSGTIENMTVLALNTSNERSYNYILALFEFLAERYSRDDNKYGQIETYVIGNEIDLSMTWNAMVNAYKDQPLAVETYVDEYYRLLRLANLAVKKYKPQNTVCTSLAHYWTKSAYELGLEGSNHNYAPKTILDYLNKRSKDQGDFNWGIASHPYGYYLQDSDLVYKDTTAGVSKGMTDNYETTTLITYTNLEVLDNYLHSENMLVNGTPRSVYITEGGISSNNNTEQNLNYQAAGLAYAYYKSANLETVKAFIYYRGWDVEEEAISNSRFGLCKYLRNNDGNITMDKKPAYDVYKYIDTPQSFEKAAPYLNSLRWQLADGSQITFEQKMKADGTDVITTVKNIMTVIGSHDWSDWSVDNIIRTK